MAPSHMWRRPTAAELNDAEQANAADAVRNHDPAPTATEFQSTNLDKLIAVALKRAGSAEGVGRLFDQLAVLAHQQYGPQVRANEHIASLLDDRIENTARTKTSILSAGTTDRATAFGPASPLGSATTTRVDAPDCKRPPNVRADERTSGLLRMRGTVASLAAYGNEASVFGQRAPPTTSSAAEGGDVRSQSPTSMTVRSKLPASPGVALVSKQAPELHCYEQPNTSPAVDGITAPTASLGSQYMSILPLAEARIEQQEPPGSGAKPPVPTGPDRREKAKEEARDNPDEVAFDVRGFEKLPQAQQKWIIAQPERIPEENATVRPSAFAADHETAITDLSAQPGHPVGHKAAVNVVQLSNAHESKPPKAKHLTDGHSQEAQQSAQRGTDDVQSTASGRSESEHQHEDSKPLGKKPILKLLFCRPEKFDQQTFIDAIPTICQRLDQRCDRYNVERALEASSGQEQRPALIFRGRSPEGGRVSYDPIAEEGLKALLERSLYAVRAEAALKSLVCWNPALFPELTESKQRRETYNAREPGPDRSLLDIMVEADGLELNLPLRAKDRSTVCQNIFDIVKNRVQTDNPSSRLLTTATQLPEKRAKGANGHPYRSREPSAKRRGLQYSLVRTIPDEDTRPGFLVTLEDCFKMRRHNSEDTQRALEAKVYRLAKTERSAFPELFPRSARQPVDPERLLGAPQPSPADALPLQQAIVRKQMRKQVPITGSTGSSKICQHFLLGHCRFGGNCRYGHVVPEGAVLVRESTDTQTKAQAKESAGREICKFFLLGRCKYGDGCAKGLHINATMPEKHAAGLEPEPTGSDWQQRDARAGGA
ncbi:hypothetical protein LTR36_007862 [Oleoguttula mirabilis]|uniref:C3H1-type domain-containing protein n=1 Tax=Oleoguttula mirabilis TaxID=1507867 RepID=A0AAV9JA11_9PEZI|nr:hypothetical protein LTR36_007862 [Oleoguttula mirabilis]